jgi:hypothetical protein
LDGTRVFNAGWIPLATGVVALTIAKLFRSIKYFGPQMALGAFAVCIASGSLATLAASRQPFQLWKATESASALANLVKQSSSPESVWVTDSARTNPVVVLGGRQTLVGHKGWLNSPGMVSLPRVRAIERLGKDAEAVEGIDEFGVEFVCVRKETDLKFAPRPDSRSWKLIFGGKSYDIFHRVNGTKRRK